VSALPAFEGWLRGLRQDALVLRTVGHLPHGEEKAVCYGLHTNDGALLYMSSNVYVHMHVYVHVHMYDQGG
jgi:hypothetical protein